MGMDPVQWVFLGFELVKADASLRILMWLVSGGWKYVLRTIGFWIDTLLVSFIGRIYDYFLQVIKGTMFNKTVVNELLKNIYLFIGIIMFFRLMMIVVKYLLNPDLVNDNKVGVTQLIQRCIIGLAGILFMPTIFNFFMDFQSHIVEDSLIQQIIIPHDMIQSVNKSIDKGGKYIGTYVLSGFLAPSENATQKTKNEYKNALKNGDLSGLIGIFKDGFLTPQDKFQYDYFFLMSTFCLCYVLYIMFKFTLDVLSRFFRLLMYQMLAPIAMIEYMINGSDDGVFKAWIKGALSSYLVLFIRSMAIWFVVFILVLMQDPNGIYSKGSLLSTNDYLLRALIIVALLGFIMDLPKLIGQIFNLDFEQEGSATGMLKQIGGMVKGAAVGALAVGGAAVGGAIGTGKAAFGASSYGKKLDNVKKDLTAKHPVLSSLNNSTKKATSGVIGAAMRSNSFTAAAYNGYSGQKQEQDKIRESARQERDDREKKNEADLREKAEKKLQEKRDDNLQKATDALTNGTMKIDPASMAAMAGVISGAMQSAQVPNSNVPPVQAQPNPNPPINNSQPTQGQPINTPTQAQTTGNATVTLDNIDVKVAGKATATYDGGLETNITGKATTTYNDGLDVQVGGQANAKYDQGIDVEVNGPAKATYSQGIDVEVNGPATARYDKGLDVEVNGTATAKYDKGIDVDISGDAKARYNGNVNVDVVGDVNAKYDGDVSTVISGNSTTVEGGTNTVIVHDTVTEEVPDVSIKRESNKKDSSNNA